MRLLLIQFFLHNFDFFDQVHIFICVCVCVRTHTRKIKHYIITLFCSVSVISALSLLGLKLVDLFGHGLRSLCGLSLIHIQMCIRDSPYIPSVLIGLRQLFYLVSYFLIGLARRYESDVLFFQLSLTVFNRLFARMIDSRHCCQF